MDVTDNSNYKEMELAALVWLVDALIDQVKGFCGFGLMINVGGDITDYFTPIIGYQDVSHVGVSDILFKCEGLLCDKKIDPNQWLEELPDGSICTFPFSCVKCENLAHPWYGNEDHLNPYILRCGEQPCWSDGTACNTHVSNPCDPTESSNLIDHGSFHDVGGTCCDGSSFWYGSDWLPITSLANNGNRCGPFPNKFEDGTICTYKVGGAFSCKACKNGSSIWWGKGALRMCGHETGYGDGTVCIPGASCNTCLNEWTVWYGNLNVAAPKCGMQPCFADGTLCGGPTFPCLETCCNSAGRWWGKAGLQACGTEHRWKDGVLCVPGASCNRCKNSWNTWTGKNAGPRCGRQPCFGRGTLCGGPFFPCKRMCCRYNGGWYNYNCD